MEKFQQYIIDYFICNLCLPSFEEICLEFGWRSKNGVYKKMQLLVDFGILIKKRGIYSLNPSVYSIKLTEKTDSETKEESDKWKRKKQEYEDWSIKK